MQVLITLNPYQGLKLEGVYPLRGIPGSNYSESLSGIETGQTLSLSLIQIQVLITLNPYQGLKLL